MVKIRNVFGDEYKGRQGNAVYQRFYGKQIRRLWDGKKENKAPGQEEQKKRFKIGLAFWESLSTAEREKLREYLREIGSDLTAQQWAVKVALSRPRVVVQSEEVLANLLMWKEGWDAIGWPYRQKLTITNNTATDLTDFQVRLELDASKVGDHFRWDLLGADLRFYDEAGNKLAYWVETWDIQNKQATVWVKVSSIKANSSATVKMYYGNSSATSESDPEQVFEFFDDFYDLSKWRVIRSGASGYPKVEDGYLKIKSSGYGTTVDTSISLTNVIIDAKVHVISNGEALMIGITDGAYSSSGLVSNGYDALWDGYPTTSTRQRLRRFSNNSCTILAQTGDGLLQNRGTYITSFVYASPTLRMLNDYNEIILATDDTYTSRNHLSISCWAGSEYWIDWVRVRKYAEQEPTAEFQSEEVGQQVTHTTMRVTVKAIEHVAIADVRVFDSEGNEIWRAEGLTNIMEGKVTSRVRLPDEVVKEGVRALVRSAAGTVDIVHL